MNEQSLHSDTQGGRVLSSISYFSIFFAPIILPIIIWIFADKPASAHAAKSLFYHIIIYYTSSILKMKGVAEKSNLFK